MKKAKFLLAATVLCSTSMVSALGSSAFVGRDNWLFYVTDGYNVPGGGVVENVIQAAKAIEASGTKVVIAIVPLKARIFSDKLPDALQLTPHAQGQYAAILSQLRKAGVTAVDLDAAFKSAKVKPNSNPIQTVFFKNDTHWTPYGSLVAATAVAKAIQSLPAAKSGAVVNYTYTEVTKQWTADLPRTFSDELQKEIGQETYVDYAYTQTGGEQSLLGGDDPKIAIVGTSYTGANIHFGDALQMLLHRNVISYSIGGGMVAKPIPQYLQSDTYKQNKPELIIWEIPEATMFAGLPAKWVESQIKPYLKK